MAAKLLISIYGQDLQAAAAILYAESQVRNGNMEGIETLVTSLEGARDFMRELIEELQPKPKDNGKQEKHVPRGC